MANFQKVYSESAAETHSINQALLDDLIDRIHIFGVEKEFHTALDEMIEKCDRFYASTVKDLIVAHYPTADTKLTPQHPEQLTKDILFLEDFVRDNVEKLRECLERHDRTKGSYQLMPAYLFKLHRQEFCPSQTMEPLLMRLSDQHKELRGRGERIEAPEHIAATERKIIKFWIKEDDVTKVICKIVKNLPIFNFGKLNRFSQPISSVYYDDDKLSSYALRLLKEDQNQLIRFRWYNDLTPGCSVYVEQKTHGDSLLTTDKTRFTLQQENILGFINGTFHPTAEFLKNHPIFVDIQQKLINDGLAPRVQTRYFRSIFQTDDDSCRVSLDTNLMMLRDFGVDTKKEWHKKDEDRMEADVHRFPFAVLELDMRKHVLANPPEWVQSFMANDLLIQVDRFSKYCHGTAMLFPDEIKTLPYWLNPNDIDSGYNEENSIDDADCHLALVDSPSAKKLRGGKSSTAEQSIFEKYAGVRGTPRVVDAKRSRPGWSILECWRSRKPKAPKVDGVLRIEPKTYFANERTYLQWFSAATIMGSVSIAMISQADNPRANSTGWIFMPFCIMVVLYALVVYHWRTHRLRNRLDSIFYSDRWGPTILTVFFIAILGVSVVYEQTEPTSTTIAPVQFDAHLQTGLEMCDISYRLIKPPQFKFFPSGSAYHGGLDRLIVTGSDGRIGVLSPSNVSDNQLWLDLWVPPAGPVGLQGVTVIAPSKSDAGVWASELYMGVKSPPCVVEMNAKNRSITRIFDLSDAVSASGANSGLTGLAIVPSTANSEGYWVYASSDKDGLVSIMQLPLRSDKSSRRGLLRYKFSPFGWNTEGMMAVDPPVVLESPPSLVIPPGKDIFPVLVETPPVEKDANHASTIGYFDGKLFVHNAKLYMTKVYELEPDTGLPVVKNGKIMETVHSLGIEDVTSLSFLPAPRADHKYGMLVSTGSGNIYNMTFDMREGYEFC